jgi:hypothetical protein
LVVNHLFAIVPDLDQPIGFIGMNKMKDKGMPGVFGDRSQIKAFSFILIYPIRHFFGAIPGVENKPILLDHQVGGRALGFFAQVGIG